MAEDKPTFFQRVDNFVRSASNAMTFGAMDYVAGAADTAVFGGSLKSNVQSELDQSAHVGAVEGGAGEVVGMLMTGAGAAKLTMKAADVTYSGYRAMRIEQAAGNLGIERSRDIGRAIEKAEATLVPAIQNGGIAAAASGGANLVKRVVTSPSSLKGPQ